MDIAYETQYYNVDDDSYTYDTTTNTPTDTNTHVIDVNVQPNVKVDGVMTADHAPGRPPALKQAYASTFFPTTIDGWTIIISSIIITILFIISAYLGGQLPFNQDLVKKFPQNTYLVAGLWVVASIVSYAGFYLLRNYDPATTIVGTLWPWFLFINYLNLLWIILFYLYESFYAAIIIVFIIILIYFYLFIIVLPLSVWAALSLVPLELLYVYLMYTFIHSASLNQIII